MIDFSELSSYSDIHRYAEYYYAVTYARYGQKNGYGRM